MILKTLTQNPSQTKNLGKILAEEILKFPAKRKKALILGLIGDLGGGKTTFLQGFAKGAGIKQRIASPTFVIIKRYKIQKTRHRIQNLYHIDCYRIQKPKEILDLGFKEIIFDPQNIVAIEWADKIKKILPQNTIWIKFEFISKNKRKILLNVP